MKRRTKTSGWSDEKRAAARTRCLQQKPWESSKGPLTDAGKARAAQNSMKHGAFSADMLYLHKVLVEQTQFLKKIMDSKRLDCYHKNP